VRAFLWANNRQGLIGSTRSIPTLRKGYIVLAKGDASRRRWRLRFLSLLRSDERPEIVTRTNTDEVAILELGAITGIAVHNGTVLATFVPDEQLVFQTYNTRMVAGHRWVVDDNVVGGVATDRSEISIFEPVFF